MAGTHEYTVVAVQRVCRVRAEYGAVGVRHIGFESKKGERRRLAQVTSHGEKEIGVRLSDKQPPLPCW